MDFRKFKESPKIIKRQFTFFVTAYIMVMSKSVCVRFDAMFDTHIVVLQCFTLFYSYQCPLLKGQLPKPLTNQQTSRIPVNPINPSGGQYTQNYP